MGLFNLNYCIYKYDVSFKLNSKLFFDKLKVNSIYICILKDLDILNFWIISKILS